MNSRTFLDTTTFVYAFTDQDVAKREICANWLQFLDDRELAATSLQVANEFTSVVMRKFPEIGTTRTFAIADEIAKLGDFAISHDTMKDARQILAQINYRYWDCILLASALELDCAYFLSEDLNAGHKIGPLTIINPMDTEPQAVIEQH